MKKYIIQHIKIINQDFEKSNKDELHRKLYFNAMYFLKQTYIHAKNRGLIKGYIDMDLFKLSDLYYAK